ncbi:hypothetical protein NXV85_23390 [Bacteroides fragilis]|nr:hypothetical protein [Bacteroides fragilis]
MDIWGVYEFGYNYNGNGGSSEARFYNQSEMGKNLYYKHWY